MSKDDFFTTARRGHPDPEVVAALESTLARAKAGLISTVAIVTVSSIWETETKIVGDLQRSNALIMSGCLLFAAKDVAETDER